MADTPEPVTPKPVSPKFADQPAALVASVLFGVIGAVLIVAGIAAGSDAVVLAGVAAGTLSLVAVLIWRSQLIDAWRHNQVRGPRG